MRSVTRSAVVALALALGACGNYSTEDLRFLAALPVREDLQVAVPSEGNPGALTYCPLGRADVWLWAKPTSDGLNRGVGFVISLIDVVRHNPPTAREENLRRWGPFPDDKHPGHEIQIVMQRSYGSDGSPVHAYAFQARETGVGEFQDIIAGTFTGASSARGHGNVVLSFDTIWALRMNDDTTPHGTMQIVYDRTGDPVTIELQLTQEGFGVVQFGYGFAGYANGTGAFDYRFRNADGDVLTVETSYDATGAGRAEVAYVASGGAIGSFRECWSLDACLTYVDDPSSFTCPAHTSCSRGFFVTCVAVPVPPFPPP